MRWLKKYPITAQEVVEVLETMHQDNPPGTPNEKLTVGGVNDFIRHKIIEYFAAGNNMASLLETME